MQIWTPSAHPRDEGDFRVDLGGTSKSFALIALSKDGNAALVMQTVNDCDRLMKAVAEAKRLLTEGA